MQAAPWIEKEMLYEALGEVEVRERTGAVGDEERGGSAEECAC